MDDCYVYIMANRRNGTIYTGCTSNLPQRVYAHKHDFVDGFTKRYGCHTLVYYEGPGSYDGARSREIAIKKWHRKWKLRLIEQGNPDWKDLYSEIL
jgi:putative endonuclease